MAEENDSKKSTEESSSFELSKKRTQFATDRTDWADQRTHLAYDRTILAHERTLMAWIRTAASMITFGFTIYKLLQEMSTRPEAADRILSPRVVGMIMIAFGMIGLLLAQIQHHNAMTKLKKFYPQAQRSTSAVMTVLILVFGLALFLGAWFRQ